MVTWFERMTKYVHAEGTTLKKMKKKKKNGLGHKSVGVPRPDLRIKWSPSYVYNKHHEHETFCRICFIISTHSFIDLYHLP